MVACLSPSDNNYDETISTLRYANRAKNIKNKPKINEDPKDAMLREYQEEIEKLKAMLENQEPGTGKFEHESQMSMQCSKYDQERPTEENCTFVVWNFFLTEFDENQ